MNDAQEGGFLEIFFCTGGSKVQFLAEVIELVFGYSEGFFGTIIHAAR